MEQNNNLKKLRNEFDENINSHIFLVETNDQEASLHDIKELIKDQISKTDEIARHQIDVETYLELIIIRKEEKDIKKNQIADLQERIKIKPILSDNIFYIIIPAESMNETAANKLLKTIEEPNPNVIGFLITEKSDLLLPTIKSRCENINLIYEKEDNQSITEDILNIVNRIITCIEKKDHRELYKIKSQDKFLKENARTVENLLKDYYNTACNMKSIHELDLNIVNLIKNNNKFEEIIKKTKYLNETFNKLSQNMNFDLLLEKIFFELRM